MVDPTPQTYNSAIARFFRRQNPKVLGTGFLVADGYLLTCAHVVEDALRIKRVSRDDDGAYIDTQIASARSAAEGEIIKIDFPFGPKDRLSAQVIGHRCDDQDIAVLQLVDVTDAGPIPISAPAGVVPITMLPGREFENTFRAYGFPSRPNGVWVHGTFEGPRVNKWVQIEGTTTKGYPVLPGLSGAPVWDSSLGGVTGMVVAHDSVEEEANAVGFMIPYRLLLPTLRMIAVWSLLAILTPHEEAIADSINAVYNVFSKLATVSTLSEKLQNLKNAIVGENDPAAIHQFVAFLSSPNWPDSDLDDELRGRLRAWLELDVENVQSVIDYVEQKLIEQQQVRSEKSESHLLIHVQPNLGGSTYDVAAWFVPYYAPCDGKVLKLEIVKAAQKEPFEKGVSREILPTLVRKCLAEVNGRSPKNLTINLILPTVLLEEAVDGLPLEPVPMLPGITIPSIRMGDRYRLVIRSSERLHPEYYRLFEELWKQKWEMLLQLKKSEVCGAFLRGDSLTTQNELWSKLSKAEIVGFKRTKAFSEMSCGEVMGTLIASGTPAAIWVRENSLADTVDCAKAVDGLLKCKIHDLPEVVKQKRSESLVKDKSVHIGHYLSLLWEDPILVPATTQSSLEMPQP